MTTFDWELEYTYLTYSCVTCLLTSLHLLLTSTTPPKIKVLT